MMLLDYATLVDKLFSIIQGYYRTYRANTHPVLLDKVANQFEFDYDPSSELIRESLHEHVGQLPIIASFVHSELALHDIDLGRVLIILSIHDIGELTYGDENTFTKKAVTRNIELEEALKLTHPSLHPYLLELEAMQTNEAKLAKSIDKMAPDIVDCLTPRDITYQRFNTQMGIHPQEIFPLIQKSKSKHMTWHDDVQGFHKEILSRLKNKLS